MLTLVGMYTQHMDTNYVLDGVTSGTDSFTLNLQQQSTDVKVGDILGIVRISQTTFDAEDSTQEATFETAPVKGFYKVKSVSLNKIELESDNPSTDFEDADGVITKFVSVRATDVEAANLIAQTSENEKVLKYGLTTREIQMTVIENTNTF